MAETTIWEGRPSQLINLGVFLLWGGILLVVLIADLYFWKDLSNAWSLLPWLGIAASLACLTLIGVRWLSTHSRKFILSSERLLVEEGIFSKKLQSLELYRVKDYSLTEPFLYRLARLGNLTILTSDPTSRNLEISAISKPRATLDLLRRQVEMRRDAKRVRELDMDTIDDLNAQG